MIMEYINREMKENNYILSTRQLTDLGISKTTLTNYVRDGLLERCGHGFYTIPDVVEDDMYLLMLRSKHVIFSHETALFLNGLSDRTPIIHAVTIPSTAAIPPTIKGQCKCYYVKPTLHKMGLTEKKTTLGNTVRCYDPERTICDILRSRNRMDEETVIAAIKNYGAYKNKNLHKLAEYAEKLGVSKQVRGYMEILFEQGERITYNTYYKEKRKNMPNASLRALLSQIYRNTHTIVGDPLRDVILFGSYARGDYDEESDIDIALIIDLAREDMKRFDDDINHMSSEISLDNDVLISIVSIPAGEYEYWKNDLPFYRNVAEGVKVHA